METLLIQQTEKSNKFWKIVVKEKDYVVFYGKIGTAGSVKAKEFETEEECMKEANKLVASKRKKGYIDPIQGEDYIKEKTITEEEFWELLHRAKTKGEDQEEQIEWLTSHLAKRTVHEIVAFDTHMHRLLKDSYTSRLWAAAYIIMGGCSDDTFDYFRGWLLYQGKETYDACIENPEQLIPVLENLSEYDVPEIEELTLYFGQEVYMEKTGDEDDTYFTLYHVLTNEEFEEVDIELDWDEDDEEGLKKMFPKLWEMYGEEPIEW
ncbi:DUF4240 domain-containing protein [Bacillus thuringiensis]|uniref:DUF4240 domain-containing protein n=1 Tax=Bacillus TaxID=1386 RepID=UPI000BECF4A2|nr:MULTISPECIES: DUF4240 domain-containing protein [Bacillus]MCI4251185.1 DUF4240 domain-containing protein [Bacillus sp. CCB-MMP212]MED3446997.1 DUF4240 domain-containing protein [Bacillus thuringiensis]MED3478031.1 DUF4240 domain-containing protein [Bacillus thuringiensis]MED3632531.1 DUF4240 domain-containing protein [Bacillus thuringiensis]PDY27980.1 hypothetical protein COM84_19710 [Bacillus thuringiensis]